MSIAQVWQFNSSSNDLPLFVGEFSSMDTAMQNFAEGVYTTFRTYEHSKVIRLDMHFSRVEESARLINFDLKLERDSLRQCLHHIVHQCPYEDIRIRLLATPEEPQSIYIFTEALVIPTEDDYRLGVQVRTARLERENPKAKVSSFFRRSKGIKKRKKDHHEIIMVGDDGIILEGLSSNFFAVIKGELFTEDKRVLAGITRQIVVEISRNALLSVRLEGIAITNLPIISEAFLTSVSRGILPVRKIDDTLIGNGVPGSITKKLMKLFDERIRTELEEI